MVSKDRDTLIKHSLCMKYSSRAVTHACKLEILQLIFTDAQQNRKILSKNIQQNREEIKELLERKIGGKKTAKWGHP